MNNSVIIDIIFCAVMAGSVITGYKRGLLKAVRSLTLWLGSLAVTATLIHFLPPDLKGGALPAVLCFIAVRFLFSVLYHVLDTIFSLPLLKQTNGIAGAAVYFVTAFIICSAVFKIMGIYYSDVLNGTVICRYVYEHSFLNLIFH